MILKEILLNTIKRKHVNGKTTFSRHFQMESLIAYFIIALFKSLVFKIVIEELKHFN